MAQVIVVLHSAAKQMPSITLLRARGLCIDTDRAFRW